jgi:hypothetical protein
MKNYIKNTNEDIKSLHVTYIMADMICHKVYEFLMSILNIYI